MSDVKFDIVRHIAVISDKGSGWTREVNLVQWNDGGTKVDIRDWSANRNQMRKGVTLNRQEFLTLVKAFRSIDAKELAEAAPKIEKEEEPVITEFPEPFDCAANE